MGTETIIRSNEYQVPGDGHLVRTEQRRVVDAQGILRVQEFRQWPDLAPWPTEELGLRERKINLA